jgi:nitrite reductase/ring-hydroxylating ferredoxin subunit
VTATSLPSSLIPTLAGRHYTDPAIFGLEQSRIFENMWFCAVRASDLATPGSFRSVQVGRESVLVGRDGQLRAFLNICRHRGARRCTDETGEVKRTFHRPYHAWTYGLDGKLIAAPNLTRMPDIDRTEYGLVAVHRREWLGTPGSAWPKLSWLATSPMRKVRTVSVMSSLSRSHMLRGMYVRELAEHFCPWYSNELRMRAVLIAS